MTEDYDRGRQERIESAIDYLPESPDKAVIINNLGKNTNSIIGKIIVSPGRGRYGKRKCTMV